MSELDKLKRVKTLFDALFMSSQNTCLIYGADEPFYKAETHEHPAQIMSRHDYLSSALHEIAHWTIAGTKRRKLDDFGYWYEPDGRSDQQQAQFERVEVKPQAVEWALAIACDHRFHLSADNLGMQAQPSNSFRIAVIAQLQEYWHNGLPERAQQLFNSLIDVFHNGTQPTLSHQCLEQV